MARQYLVDEDRVILSAPEKLNVIGSKDVVRSSTFIVPAVAIGEPVGTLDVP